jgi:hypothetical protein
MIAFAVSIGRAWTVETKCVEARQNARSNQGKAGNALDALPLSASGTQNGVAANVRVVLLLKVIANLLCNLLI